MSCSVSIAAASSARTKASIAERPLVSSPMPGASSRVPSRRTVTSVPAGNTVSRCAATTTAVPLPRPRRSPVTLPTASIATSSSPAAVIFARIASARRSSMKGGAGISVSSISSATRRS